MKKRFRDKRCAYCCCKPATTEDHVFATGFSHKADRDNNPLPKAPACDDCNGKKSKLDEYAMTVLAFGARHTSALPIVDTVGIRRVQNNKPLHKKLQQGYDLAWVNDPSGLLVPTSTFPVDSRPLSELFEYIARGLIWRHWGAYLENNEGIHVMFLTQEGDRDFRECFARWPGLCVRENLRNETVRYEGLHNPGDPQFSAWRISIYGGVHIARRDPAKGVCTTIGIITGKQHRPDAERTNHVQHRPPLDIDDQNRDNSIRNHET